MPNIATSPLDLATIWLLRLHSQKRNLSLHSIVWFELPQQQSFHLIVESSFPFAPIVSKNLRPTWITDSHPNIHDRMFTSRSMVLSPKQLSTQIQPSLPITTTRTTKLLFVRILQLVRLPNGVITNVPHQKTAKKHMPSSVWLVLCRRWPSPFTPACPPFDVHRIHSLLAISFMCIPIPSSLLPTKHTNHLTRTPPQLPTTPQPPMILREHMTLPTHTPCSHPSTRNRVTRLDSVHKRLMSTRRIIFPPTKPKVSEMCCRNSRRCGKTGLVE